MATTKQVGTSIWGSFAGSLLVLWIAVASGQAVAQDTSNASSDEALSKKLMGEIAIQIEAFCTAHKVSSLQVVEFRGTVGTRDSADVKRDWLDSLQERGISMREVDSTRITGRVLTQQSGNSEIILLMCTLSDSTGADIRTFRVRTVLSPKPVS